MTGGAMSASAPAGRGVPGNFFVGKKRNDEPLVAYATVDRICVDAHAVWEDKRMLHRNISA